MFQVCSFCEYLYPWYNFEWIGTFSKCFASNRTKTKKYFKYFNGGKIALSSLHNLWFGGHDSWIFKLAKTVSVIISHQMEGKWLPLPAVLLPTFSHKGEPFSHSWQPRYTIDLKLHSGDESILDAFNSTANHNHNITRDIIKLDYYKIQVHRMTNNQLMCLYFDAGKTAIKKKVRINATLFVERNPTR